MSVTMRLGVPVLQEKRRYRHGIVERRRQIATAIRSLDAELIRLRWNAEAEVDTT